MSVIESCQNFKRFQTSSGEVQWCSGKGTNVDCSGWSDFCPPKLQKYFVPTGRIPLSEVSFERTTERTTKPGQDRKGSPSQRQP